MRLEVTSGLLGLSSSIWGMTNERLAARRVAKISMLLMAKLDRQLSKDAEGLESPAGRAVETLLLRLSQKLSRPQSCRGVVEVLSDDGAQGTCLPLDITIRLRQEWLEDTRAARAACMRWGQCLVGKNSSCWGCAADNLTMQPLLGTLSTGCFPLSAAMAVQ